MIAALVVGVATFLLLTVQYTHFYYKRKDLLVGLHDSLAYEAIALYNDDADDPIFEWVPDIFAEVLSRDVNPLVGQHHWDYWQWFKDSRKDWDAIIKRVLNSGIAEGRDSEAIIYPNGRRVYLSWVCGPRYDAGRFWRKRKPCGFYITHTAVVPDQNKLEEIAPQIEAMKKANMRLEAMLEADERARAAASIQRLMTNLGYLDQNVTENQQ